MRNLYINENDAIRVNSQADHVLEPRTGAAVSATKPQKILPELIFPEELPVSECRFRILEALHKSPVVIVCGETGSGKTTQLPKICALAGRGKVKLIGHTQPRRIAAVSVAKRIAEELKSPLGVHVGYRVRFQEISSENVSIQLMTDGVLLAETKRDPHLNRYDTLIIDEVHERTLNIDFLLGYLKRLIEGPRAKDLKIILTSATVDSDKLARFFDPDIIDTDGSCSKKDSSSVPIINVSGRLYPVRILYWDEIQKNAPQSFNVEDKTGNSETDALGLLSTFSRWLDASQIEGAVDYLWSLGSGDILVFLPGEYEIRSVGNYLKTCYEQPNSKVHRPWRTSVEILSLYARLPVSQQQKVLGSSRCGRRIILSTNVAETSITVPGIKFVIDSGLGRVNRYRYRSKIQVLSLEPVSQAQANQRAGRCGRVAEGVCIRLFDAESFASRPQFADPEILRSSLSSVILQMKALGLPDIACFPLLDPPGRKAITDGYALLRELGALDEFQELTEIGRVLTRIPIDPKLARMVLSSRDLGCLREVRIIVAALSSPDPRERIKQSPSLERASSKKSEPFTSDFGLILNWWEEGIKLIGSCKGKDRIKSFSAVGLSFRAFKEWMDVHKQLVRVTSDLGWTESEKPAGHESWLRAILTGLLGNLGVLAPSGDYYSGSHQVRFWIHKSSCLTRKKPQWVMAAELVETSRLSARWVAKIDPKWIEEAAQHLIVKDLSDPVWSRSDGRAISYERGLLYGLVVYSKRRVAYSKKNPSEARKLFIHQALVLGEWESSLVFFVENRRLLQELQDNAARLRSSEIILSDEEQFSWYDSRIPDWVCCTRSCEAWCRKISDTEFRGLSWTREVLLKDQCPTLENFPSQVSWRGVTWELTYRFEPGALDDGITMTVPLGLLNQVDSVQSEWLVPGMLQEKILALLQSLPQKIRQTLPNLRVYAAEFVARALGLTIAERGAICACLIQDIKKTCGIFVHSSDFKREKIPMHLLMRFKIEDSGGSVVDEGRDWQLMQKKWGALGENAFQQALGRLCSDRVLSAESAVPTKPEEVLISGVQEKVTTKIPNTLATFPQSSHSDFALGGKQGVQGCVQTKTAFPLDKIGLRFFEWPSGLDFPESICFSVDSDSEVGAKSLNHKSLVGFPAWTIDDGEGVVCRCFDLNETAQEAHRSGVYRLFSIALNNQLMKHCEKNFPGSIILRLASCGISKAGLLDSLRYALVDWTCFSGNVPRTFYSFKTALSAASQNLDSAQKELVLLLETISVGLQKVLRGLDDFSDSNQSSCVLKNDLREQLEGLLLNDCFLKGVSQKNFRCFPRYIKGIQRRVDRHKLMPSRLETDFVVFRSVFQRWKKLIACAKSVFLTKPLEELKWTLEELRISLFAQELGTERPVSLKKVQRQLDEIERSFF